MPKLAGSNRPRQVRQDYDAQARQIAATRHGKSSSLDPAWWRRARTRVEVPTHTHQRTQLTPLPRLPPAVPSVLQLTQPAQSELTRSSSDYRPRWSDAVRQARYDVEVGAPAGTGRMSSG